MWDHENSVPSKAISKPNPQTKSDSLENSIKVIFNDCMIIYSTPNNYSVPLSPPSPARLYFYSAAESLYRTRGAHLAFRCDKRTTSGFRSATPGFQWLQTTRATSPTSDIYVNSPVHSSQSFACKESLKNYLDFLRLPSQY